MPEQIIGKILDRFNTRKEREVKKLVRKGMHPKDAYTLVYSKKGKDLMWQARAQQKNEFVAPKGYKFTQQGTLIKKGNFQGEMKMKYNYFKEEGMDKTASAEKPKKKKSKVDFGMLSVKAGIDNNPAATKADKIVGAKMKKKASIFPTEVMELETDMKQYMNAQKLTAKQTPKKETRAQAIGGGALTGSIVGGIAGGIGGMRLKALQTGAAIGGVFGGALMGLTRNQRFEAHKRRVKNAKDFVALSPAKQKAQAKEWALDEVRFAHREGIITDKQAKEYKKGHAISVDYEMPLADKQYVKQAQDKTAANVLTKSILKHLKSGKGIKGTAKQLKVDEDLVTSVARKNIQAKTTSRAISKEQAKGPVKRFFSGSKKTEKGLRDHAAASGGQEKKVIQNMLGKKQILGNRGSFKNLPKPTPKAAPLAKKPAPLAKAPVVDAVQEVPVAASKGKYTINKGLTTDKAKKWMAENAGLIGAGLGGTGAGYVMGKQAEEKTAMPQRRQQDFIKAYATLKKKFPKLSHKELMAMADESEKSVALRAGKPMMTVGKSKKSGRNKGY